MAIRPTLPESPGCPARWKVRPPLDEVKTAFGLTPGCGSDGLVQSSATSAGDAAATAVASGRLGGQLNGSLDQCLPPSVDADIVGATPAQTEWPDTVSASAGATPATRVHVLLPTRLRYSRAWPRPPLTGSAAANTTPSDAASAMTSPGRDTRCHRRPPSVVAHRPGLNAHPSLALENRTVLTSDSGRPLNGGTSDTGGGGTVIQVLPPLTVLRNSALHGSLLQPRMPSTNPVCADTKLAEAASNPVGGGGFPLAGSAVALPAPSATSTAGRAASTTARPNDTLIFQS